MTCVFATLSLIKIFTLNVIDILQRVLQGTNGSSPEAVEEVSFLYNTYVTSLYWSAATVTSTGYGDVRAYTIPEKVFSVFVMIIG